MIGGENNGFDIRQYDLFNSPVWFLSIFTILAKYFEKEHKNIVK